MLLILLFKSYLAYLVYINEYTHTGKYAVVLYAVHFYIYGFKKR